MALVGKGDGVRCKSTSCSTSSTARYIVQVYKVRVHNTMYYVHRYDVHTRYIVPHYVQYTCTGMWARVQENVQVCGGERGAHDLTCSLALVCKVHTTSMYLVQVCTV